METRKTMFYVRILAILMLASLACTIALWHSHGQNKEKEENSIAEQVAAIYDVDQQAAIKEALEEEKASKTYTESDMLVKYNPFGTNTQSLYVYFQTEKAVQVSYTVHVEDESIDDFSGQLTADGVYATEHEYQLIGLIPNQKNTITFTLTGEDGSVDIQTIFYTMGSLLGSEDLQVETEVLDDSQEVADGLYAILGKDSDEQDFVYYYDNRGVLRSEIPIIGYRAHRLLFSGDKMYFSISQTKIAEMDRLGQVTNVYSLGDYNLHHDYVFDNDGNLVILATDTNTDTQEDMVVKLDLETGEVTKLLDLGDMFASYKAICEQGSSAEPDSDAMDWMHINSIQWIGDGSVLLSSRETSTILKIDDLETNPTLEYMIGEESFWEGTEYADSLLTKLGDFTSQAGQHSITYETSDELAEGQYYLYMFNNNLGVSSTQPDYDWSQLNGVETSLKETSDNPTSYYYQYLVDENAGTYQLVQSFKVPFSGYVSSVQKVGNNILVDSGLYNRGEKALVGEYDADGNLIQQMTFENLESMVYRVFKYDFNGYYFKIAS